MLMSSYKLTMAIGATLQPLVEADGAGLSLQNPEMRALAPHAVKVLNKSQCPGLSSVLNNCMIYTDLVLLFLR